MIVDAHTHAWRRWPYEPPSVAGFDVDGLLDRLDASGVDHAILVAARIDPTHPGRANSDNNTWLADAVGRSRDRLSLLADLDSRWSASYHRPGALDRLEELGRLPIVGVTHYLADDDDGWLEHDDADAVLGSLADRGLMLSLHAPPAWHRSLGRALRRHPGLTVLIHHLGLAGPGERAGMLDLAGIDGVHVKVSGMYYLSDEPYPFPAATAWLRELADTFGAERLLWGSDHPVSARRGYPYEQMLEAVRATAVLDEVERMAVLGGTAARLLGLAS